MNAAEEYLQKALADSRAATERAWAYYLEHRGDDPGPLLPTPTARDWKGVPGSGVQMASLPRAIAQLFGGSDDS